MASTTNREVEFPAWGWRDCAVGLGVAVAALVLIVAVLSLFVTRGGGDRSVRELLLGLGATLAFEVSLFAIALALTAGKYGGGPRVLGWLPRRPDAWIGWTLLALALSYLTLGVYTAVTSFPALHGLQPKSNVPTGLFDHRATIALAVFLTVIVAPIVEETFFRGFIFNGLRRSLGFSGAATLSGVLFAVAHTSPGLIIPFTVIGVIFAYLYRRTGTLWTSMSAHMLFNLVSVVFALAK